MKMRICERPHHVGLGVVLVATFSGCERPPTPASPESSPTAGAPEPATAAEEAFDLYRAAYGESGRPLVFLHGGPGYNSALFEATTAEVLASEFRVVVYDRAGTGRNKPTRRSAFTFEQAGADLDRVLEGLEDPVLIGHSFGGAVALNYLEARPDFDGEVLLVDAPLSYPLALEGIIAACRLRYEAAADAENIDYLDQLETMDPASADYAGFAFRHAISCGLYSPATPSDEAKAIKAKAAEHPDAGMFSKSSPGAFQGFLANEAYTSIDLAPLVEKFADRLSAINGAEDALIPVRDRELLRQTLGERYVEIPGASHNVFVDQQDAFIDAVRRAAG